MDDDGVEDDEQQHPFFIGLQIQMEDAMPDRMPDMNFDAQLKTLGERLTSVAELVEQHRREMTPTGMPDPMIDMTSWNLYQTAFHLAVRDL